MLSGLLILAIILYLTTRIFSPIFQSSLDRLSLLLGFKTQTPKETTTANNQPTAQESEQVKLKRQADKAQRANRLAQLSLTAQTTELESASSASASTSTSAPSEAQEEKRDTPSASSTAVSAPLAKAKVNLTLEKPISSPAPNSTGSSSSASTRGTGVAALHTSLSTTPGLTEPPTPVDRSKFSPQGDAYQVLQQQKQDAVKRIAVASESNQTKAQQHTTQVNKSKLHHHLHCIMSNEQQQQQQSSLQSLNLNAASSPNAAAASSGSRPSSRRSSVSAATIATHYSSLPTHLYVHSASLSAEERAKQWQHQALLDCFSLTLDRESATTPSALNTTSKTVRTFLPQTAEDLDGSSLCADLLDSVLIERLALPLAPFNSAIAYLTSCFKRATELQNALTQTELHLSSAPVASQLTNASVYPLATSDFVSCREIVQSCSQRCVNYSYLLLTGAMDSESKATSRDVNLHEFIHLLMTNTGLGRSLPSGFLDALIASYASSSDELSEFLMPLFDSLQKQHGATPTVENALQTLSALHKLCRHPQVAKLFVRHKNFLPRAAKNASKPLSGRALQLSSMFGMLLSHVAPPDRFSNVASRPRHEVEQEVETMRSTHAGYQTALCDLFKLLCRVDKSVRQRCVEFFATVLTANIDRKKMRHDPRQMSSDSFWVNLTTVMMRLALPVVKPAAASAAAASSVAQQSTSASNTPRHADSASSPLSDLPAIAAHPSFPKVDLRFLLQNASPLDPKQPVFDFDSSTRLYSVKADIEALKAEHSASLQSVEYNFSTEILFLTWLCLSIGWQPLVRRYNQVSSVLHLHATCTVCRNRFFDAAKCCALVSH